MKIDPERYIDTLRKFVLLIFLILLIPEGCKSDKKKGLIPEKTFAKILYEIHLADGLLALPDIHDKYYSRDSVANYTDIVENHDYTKEAFDKTLRYYFTEKPKKFIRIYDHAIGKLTEMESLLEGISEDIPALSGGLWKGSQLYLLTGNRDTTKLYFDHIFYTAGDYTLQFTLTLFPSDQTLNPCFTAYTCRADSLVSGKRTFLRGPEYIKDGRPHTYSFVLKIPDNLPTLIKGHLLDFENNPAEISRHARIEGISFVLSSAVQ